MIDTRVGRLQVQVVGDGDLPTALLWHSLFVDERSWHRVVPALSADRRLVLVTGPGHGSSTDPGRRYTNTDCAAAALEVLDALGIADPVDWVGNAWGGHIGLAVAAAHPERIRTLVTCGTPTHPYPVADRLRTGALLAIYRLVGPVGFIADAVVEALLSEQTRRTDPDAAAGVRDAFVSADRRRMANAIVSVSLRRTDATALLAEPAPTLFITGSAHPDWSPEQMRAAAAKLPRGSTAVLDGCAYLGPLEAPDAFADLVRAFWAGAA
jgi:pimeloyl-ACP methyl ester carboxylesterase